MKKNQVTMINTPWYITLSNWIIESLSYKERLTKEPMMHNVVEVEVTLADGRKGITSFEDFFDIDKNEGKYTMKKTGLKYYQEKDKYRSQCFSVRFSKNEEDWAPIYSDKIVQWGEPQYKSEIYPWRLYAVKLFGLTYDYESRLAKYCEAQD